jgi:hypothetical protein
MNDEMSGQAGLITIRCPNPDCGKALSYEIAYFKDNPSFAFVCTFCGKQATVNVEERPGLAALIKQMADSKNL